MKIYAQLYSVRELLKQDFWGTLENLARFGYDGVEFAGYFGIPAEEMKLKLAETGLEAVSSHVSPQVFFTGLDKEIAYARVLGIKHLVLPASDMTSAEKAAELAPQVTAAGKKCADAGITLSYHNHDFEFAGKEGERPIDIFYARCDPQLVKQQPDLYWIEYCGFDANRYLAKHAARCPTVHLKQLKDRTGRENCNAGDGIIDFAQSMRNAPDALFIYEQENTEGRDLECMRLSVQFIKQP